MEIAKELLHRQEESSIVKYSIGRIFPETAEKESHRSNLDSSQTDCEAIKCCFGKYIVSQEQSTYQRVCKFETELAEEN